MFKPLQDAALFAQAKRDRCGTSVVWVDDAIDMGTDNLRHLATEQAGGIGHEFLIHWLHDNQLTQEKCRVPCDYVPRRSWLLFKARAVLEGLLAPLNLENKP